MKKTSRWMAVSVLSLVMLPVLYVLSYGPAAWTYAYALHHYWIEPGKSHAEAALIYFYYPLAWLGGNGPTPIADTLNWYAALFAR